MVKRLQAPAGPALTSHALLLHR